MRVSVCPTKITRPRYMDTGIRTIPACHTDSKDHGIGDNINNRVAHPPGRLSAATPAVLSGGAGAAYTTRRTASKSVKDRSWCDHIHHEHDLVDIATGTSRLVLMPRPLPPR